mmetsp:Transcript_15207/g.31077  ORF Transcript_15207/g.31077 Transcript_15207/m.31077 type:complete len:123 (-) Transcript_15207:314-682(-)
MNGARTSSLNNISHTCALWNWMRKEESRMPWQLRRISAKRGIVDFDGWMRGSLFVALVSFLCLFGGAGVDIFDGSNGRSNVSAARIARCLFGWFWSRVPWLASVPISRKPSERHRFNAFRFY